MAAVYKHLKKPKLASVGEWTRPGCHDKARYDEKLLFQKISKLVLMKMPETKLLPTLWAHLFLNGCHITQP